MFDGESTAVEVNRAAGNKPSVGEVLFGTITEDKYGPKFKAEKQPTGTYTPTPKDTSEIKAEWAIGQAVASLKSELKDPDPLEVEALAKDYFAMVDRVKTGEPSGKAKAAAVVAGLRAKNTVEKELELPSQTQDIDPDDIPF